MAAVIVDEELWNKEFVETRTEDFDSWAKALADWSPERGAEVCGVAAEDIRRAARLYAKAERAGIFYAMGVTQHSSGTDGVMCLSNLALACGKLGRPGCGINPLRGQNNVQGACDMGCLPDVLPGYQKVADPAVRAKFERAWGRGLSANPGQTVSEMIDPLATGLLIVCIGKATKKIESLQAEEKEYMANVCFGATTPCFDLEKPIDAEYPFEHITEEKLQQIIPQFLGEQDQVAPLFSAKLVDGVRAYELARGGSDMELKPHRITIHELRLLQYNTPVADFMVRCSKGTYIRSLARDLGLALDSGAHLTGLRRTSSGNFRVEDAYSMEKIEEMFEELKQTRN